MSVAEIPLDVPVKDVSAAPRVLTKRTGTSTAAVVGRYAGRSCCLILHRLRGRSHKGFSSCHSLLARIVPVICR